jgi:hypothetical protein
MGGWTGRSNGCKRMDNGYDTFRFSRNLFPFFSSLLHALTHCLALCHCCFSPPAGLFLSLWVSTCPVLVTRHDTLSELRGPCIHASFVFLPTHLLVALNIAVVRRLD